MKVFVALLAAQLSATAVAAQKNVHLFGPAPDWSEYRRIAEAEVIARLIDPESARISWVTGYAKGGYKPFLSPRIEGYVACGEVNARNRMGGYAGASWFLVVIDYDRVLTLLIDKGASVAAGECQKMMREGRLPPVPAGSGTMVHAAASSQQATPGQPAGTTTGLTLQAMPDGAYVSGVRAGSPAAGAGLKPGMVIASVNAIPLAGMGDAMLKVVEAAGPGAALSIVGGRTFTLEKRP